MGKRSLYREWHLRYQETTCLRAWVIFLLNTKIFEVNEGANDVQYLFNIYSSLGECLVILKAKLTWYNIKLVMLNGIKIN